MIEGLFQMIDACDINDKLHYDKSKLLSYLSILEKIYDNQKNDNSDQERIFRLSKAINSIKNYSNIKVTAFNLKNLSSNKKEKSEDDDNKDSNEKDNEKTEIDDLLCFIEKELKLNGIDVNNVNDSFLSTNVKSENSDSKSDTTTPGKVSENKPETIIANNTNQKNQRRLSKLFLKLEMKLKTFLQENSQNSSTTKLISDKEKVKDNIDNKNEDENISKKARRRPSKLPDLSNSFFSNKEKVEALLNRAKKQRRRSMVEFNAKFLNKEKKKEEYTENSLDKNAKNRKIVPCTAQINRPKRKKRPKMDENKRVSNFFDMIIEKDEDNEIEDINPFKEISEKINEENPKENEENMINEHPIFIDNNDTSIKITSTINKNKINNDDLNKKAKLKNNTENENDINNSECKIVLNINSDDKNEIFYHSSDKDSMSDSQYDDDSDDDDSSSYDSDDEKNVSNKDLNNSNSSKDSKEESSQESNEKKNVINLSKGKCVKRNSNFNNFFRKSIFSPWKDIVDNKEHQNNLIEDFSKNNL